MSRAIQANTRSEGVHAISAPTIIACAVVMVAPCIPAHSIDNSPLSPVQSAPGMPAPCSCSIAAVFLVCDRRLRKFVEPFPIGLVAFPLTCVGFAALGRTKLLEVPAESDQPEGAVAVSIPAAVCHDAASAFGRRIQRTSVSWPSPKQKRAPVLFRLPPCSTRLDVWSAHPYV